MSHVGATSRVAGQLHPMVGGGHDGPSVPIDLRERWSVDFDPLGAALPVGVLTVVGMGTAVYLNAAAVALLGGTEDDLLGHGWEGSIHAEDRAELVGAIAVLLVISASIGAVWSARKHEPVPKSPDDVA